MLNRLEMRVEKKVGARLGGRLDEVLPYNYRQITQNRSFPLVFDDMCIDRSTFDELRYVRKNDLYMFVPSNHLDLN